MPQFNALAGLSQSLFLLIYHDNILWYWKSSVPNKIPFSYKIHILYELLIYITASVFQTNIEARIQTAPVRQGTRDLEFIVDARILWKPYIYLIFSY